MSTSIMANFWGGIDGLLSPNVLRTQEPRATPAQDNLSLLEFMTKSITDAGRVALDRSLLELRSSVTGQQLEQQVSQQASEDTLQRLIPLFALAGLVIAVLSFFMSRK